MLANLNSLDQMFADPRVAFLFILLSLWALAWKGVALWKSARNSQRNWFVALLLINTFSILELVYIFYFQKREKKESIPPE